ncbi:MAG: hypothetical protein WCR56_05530 [Bacilli bacterium]|jgi:hypothetical protein
MDIKIDCENGENKDVHINTPLLDQAKKKRFYNRVANIIDSSSFALFALAYLILALAVKDKAPSGYSSWAVYWTLILLGSVPGGIFRAITNKKLCTFPIWAIACFIYLFIGMYASLWHPYWVILLLIPIYYSICGPIDSLVEDHRKGNI